MKMLLNINIILRDKVIDISTTTNNRVSSIQSSLSRADDNNNTFRFMKDLVSRSSFGDDSSITNLIRYIKETDISDFNKILFNLINMNVERSSNIQYEMLLVEEKN